MRKNHCSYHIYFRRNLNPNGIYYSNIKESLWGLNLYLSFLRSGIYVPLQEPPPQCKICTKWIHSFQKVKKYACEHLFHKECVREHLLCPIEGCDSSPLENRIQIEVEPEAQAPCISKGTYVKLCVCLTGLFITTVSIGLAIQYRTI